MRINTFSILCLALLAASCSKDNTTPTPSASSAPSAPAAAATAPAAPASANQGPVIPSTLTFPTYGFSINSLESVSFASGVRALSMALPENQGFESSVNVQIQSATNGMAAYVSDSRKALDQLKFSIISEKPATASEWTVEYMGLVQNIAMHWYAHAVWSNGKVYLATSITPDVHWPIYGAQLRSCVDSLQVPGSTSALNFPNYGFRINPLDAPLTGSTVHACELALPADQNFPPNVNVQIQPAPNGMAAYQVDSKKQMDQIGFSIVSATNPSTNEWTIEYIGLVRGIAIRWYARAIWKDGRVYLATGQVPDVLWNAYADKLKKCVDSLQATGTEKFAPTPPAPAASTATGNSTSAPATNTSMPAAAPATTTAAP